MTSTSVVRSRCGAFFGGVASIGIVRLPDVYTRAHAASKSEHWGPSSLSGPPHSRFRPTSRRSRLSYCRVHVSTNPTAAHAIARAAQDQGIEPWTTGDEEDKS